MTYDDNIIFWCDLRVLVELQLKMKTIILFLTSGFSSSENIKPICLPLSRELRAKDYVARRPFIAGWGSISFGKFTFFNKKKIKKKKKYVQRLDTGIFMVLLQPTCFCISRSKQRYSVGAASASGS